MPSRSALRVALRRAAHQLYDDPPFVFDDPLAVSILGKNAGELSRTPGRNLGRRPGERARPQSFSQRAFIVARSRYAEDLLSSAYERGARQYILLGAGLDTFAWRNPWPDLRVMEVDHPATQAWKNELLAGAGVSRPTSLISVPHEFESLNARKALVAAGLRPAEAAVFACLGVIPYLSLAAFDDLLRLFSGQDAGSAAVFDYTEPRDGQTGFDRLARDSISARLRATGEPYCLHQSAAEVQGKLAEHGLVVQEDLGAVELNLRYFARRTDNLKILPSAGRIVAVQTGDGGL